LIGGYDHFVEHRQPGAPAGSTPGCKLWDHDEAQNDAANVVRARDAAVAAQQERAALEGMELEEADLAVEAPAAPPAGPDQLMINHLRGMGPPPPGHGGRYDPAQMAARFGFPPGLGGLGAIQPLPAQRPALPPFILNAQAAIFRPPPPPPTRHRPLPLPVPPPGLMYVPLPGRDDAMYEEFLEEAQAHEGLRDQMREQRGFLRGPPPFEVERAALRAERREARAERAGRVAAREARAINMAELQAERNEIGGELARLVARRRAQEAARLVRLAEQEH